MAKRAKPAKAGGSDRPAKPAKPAAGAADGAARAGPDATVLDRLYATVASRKGADPDLSHSARLLARGTAKVAQKLGEEAVETVIEATRGNSAGLVAESADLLYHLMVVWVDAGILPASVWAELQRREGVGGLAEKAARPRPLALPPQRRGLPRSRKLW
ncbi:MAG: phosphoribosyl-ATP diphosphatase [Acetobacteraceae bacterium]